MGKSSLTTATIMISLFLMACGGRENASSSDTPDDTNQPPEADAGVPSNLIEQSGRTDTVEQQKENNAGVPLDNLNRSKDDDSTAVPPNMD